MRIWMMLTLAALTGCGTATAPEDAGPADDAGESTPVLYVDACVRLERALRTRSDECGGIEGNLTCPWWGDPGTWGTVGELLDQVDAVGAAPCDEAIAAAYDERR